MYPRMTTPMTDRISLDRNRARATDEGMFLHRAVADEIQDRLDMVNKPFTTPAIVTGFAPFWRALHPDVTILGDTDTLDLALQASGCGQVHVVHKPRLLSDNGSSYVSGDLAEWLKDKGMKHSRGAPYHPQTQGKIERWHQTLKNRILLENYFLPGDLEAQIEAFVDHYKRYHESINNVTPADVYFGRVKAILKQRERIKRKTLEARRLHHRQHAA